MDFIETLKTDYNIHLNDQQIRAVQMIDGAVLLLAVPGSGKTTVLISRLANMIVNHHISPGKILTLTFSKLSAVDMKNRYQHLFGSIKGIQPHFSTIHSFCYSAVKTFSKEYHRNMPAVLSDNSTAIRKIYCAVNHVGFVDRETIDGIISQISYCKNRMLGEKQIEEIEVENCDFPKVFSTYCEYKRENSLMDYDDMLVFTYELFCKRPQFLAEYQNRYQYFNVDEAQDTSLVQHKIMHQLAQNGNIFMVGDEDQSIYGFRGAFPNALLDFDRDYENGVILKMEQNYRSVPAIVQKANTFIKQNKIRIHKEMFSKNLPGKGIEIKKVKCIEGQYQWIADYLKQQDVSTTIAILYRYNESAIPLVDVLNRQAIHFHLKDTRDAFFHKPLVKDMIAFFKLSQNPSDIDSFQQIYNKTNAYFNRNVLDYVQSHYRRGDSIFDLLLSIPDADKSKVQLLKSKIERLNSLTPARALSEIQNSIVSRDYLKSDNGEQRFSIFKTIAAQEGTVTGLLQRLTELQKIVANPNGSEDSNLTLSTIHSSKGLEYDIVIMVDLIEGQFPSKQCLDELKKGNRTDYEEEVRLFYVGVTRAKQELQLIALQSNSKDGEPSQFIDELIREPIMHFEHKKSYYSQKDFSNSDLCQYCSPVTDSDKLQVGLHIRHHFCGVGTITTISKDTLQIEFAKQDTKTFSMEHCILNQLLYSE